MRKTDLRNQHKQQRLKHEKRLREAVNVEEVPEASYMSSTQAGKLVGYFSTVDFKKMNWWRIKEQLVTNLQEKKGLKMEPDMDNGYSTKEEALEQLLVIGEAIAMQVSTISMRPHSEDEDEVLWAKKMIKEGVLKDKAAAAVTLVEACPMVNSARLKSILAHVNAINRTEKDIGIAAMVQLYESKLLIPNNAELHVFKKPMKVAEKKQEFTYNETALKFFIKKRGNKYYVIKTEHLANDGPLPRLFLCLVFEHILATSIAQYLFELHTRVSDSVEHTRRVVYESCIDMIRKPSQRETATRIALRYLGDSSSSLHFKIGMAFGKLFVDREDLKPYVCARVEEIIWMQQVDAHVISRRDAGGFLRGATPKSTEGTLAKVSKRAKSAKRELKRLVRNVDDNLLVRHAGEQRAHTTICNATKFLAEVCYSTKRKSFIEEQFQRFLRLLRRFMAPSAAPKLLSLHAKQLKFVRAQKKKQRKAKAELINNVPGTTESTEPSAGETKKVPGSLTDPTVAEAAARRLIGDPISYATGLGNTISGTQVLHHVLHGLKRLIPYTSDEKAMKLMIAEPRTGESVMTFVAVSDELMKIAHKAPCLVTRVHAWVLCHLMLSKVKEQGRMVGNLYAQLKDLRMMQTRARHSWLELHLAIVADMSCSAVTRGAYLRRLVSVLALSDCEGALLPVFAHIDSVLSRDETAFREWILECLGAMNPSGTVQGTGYDADAFNPERSHSLSSMIWELTVARCHIVSSPRDGFAALQIATAASESDTDTDRPSVLSLLGWDSLQPVPLDSTHASAAAATKRLHKTMLDSQSLSVLYRLLVKQTLRKALSARGGEEKKADETLENLSDDDAAMVEPSSFWDLDIYNNAFWHSVTDAHFPFRRLLEPAFRESAKDRRPGAKDFEDEVDRMADAWVTGATGLEDSGSESAPLSDASFSDVEMNLE